jgi:hypothetical protein
VRDRFTAQLDSREAAAAYICVSPNTFGGALHWRVSALRRRKRHAHLLDQKQFEERSADEMPGVWAHDMSRAGFSKCTPSQPIPALAGPRSCRSAEASLDVA